ncbi:type VII secretion protein [Bacillus cereus]|uniref:WXG100 family type VII secretion target n=1 Tax=Bacillus sp. AFS023182 TaxID=2033492 RepID=UPI000BF58D81|nr:WXG100 family type VII secretion target [Bacillus sp. AFS023182]PFE03374.1 type VII secretion protein [Bacillus sp. AFS023182]PGX90412.1 type VII secretion protein [Bacillus cereus]
MGNIKVTPEELRKVAWSIRSTITNAKTTQEQLKKDIDMLCNAWMGATYMKFNTDFRDYSLRMARFTIILEPLEKFLLATAQKFEETDNMEIASFVGSVYLQEPVNGQTEILTGSAEWKEDGRLGGKGEGDLVTGKFAISENTNFSFKAGHGEIDINAPYTFDAIKEDLFTGNIIGGKVGVTGLENTITTSAIFDREMKVTQKFLDGSLAYGIEDYTFKDDAELTVQKYELSTKIDIPDFIPIIGEYDLEVRGELGLGTFGYRFHVGQETGGYVGGGKVGGGLFAKFVKQGEE